MHFVRKLDEATFQTPAGYSDHSRSFGQISLVDRTVGSVHMGFNLCQLGPDGMVAPHIHAYEEGFYILWGQILGRIDNESYQFGPGDFGVIPAGTLHAWRSVSLEPVRWLEIAAPQPKPAGQERDTFFSKSEVAPSAGATLDDKEPNGQLVGHLNTRLVSAEPQVKTTYLQGVLWKMLVDQSLGARNLTLSFSKYHPNVSLSLHDHSFEEAFFVLRGEMEAVLDGKRYTVRAGDVLWVGVGCVHSFANVSDGATCWLAVQVPQPLAHRAFRFVDEWEVRGSALENE